VLGKTSYDQNWSDDVTEGLVGGCGQPRPKARPPQLDRKPVAKLPVKAKPKKKWLPSLTTPTPTPKPVTKPPVANTPPEPLDPPAQPKPVPPATDWWYYLRR
jgi:hypothetical protein